MQKVAFRTKIRLTIKYLNKIFKYKIDKYAGCYRFPYLDIRKPHRFQLNVRSLIQVEQVKTRGVRAIRQYNSVGDSVMSLTE